MIEQYINKITNADCLDILKQLPDKCIDLVLTDPPYGMNFQSNHRKEKHEKIANDDNLLWLPEYMKEISRVKKEDAMCYFFCSWHNVDLFKQEIEKFFPVKNILIWEKNNTGMGDLFADYAPQYDMIIFCNPKNKKLQGGRDSTILKYPRTGNEFHPTQKPVDLIAKLIRKSTNENDVVLDTFAGSCPVAFACVDMKRNFICVEKDFDYWKASCKRLEEHQKQLSLF